MSTQEQILKQKRQYYHQLLIALGEERYKEVIVETRFGVDSTTRLNIGQLDELISDAQKRLNTSKKPDPRYVKMWRNKCLLVLNERGIIASPKNWDPVNNELAKKQFQWIMTADQAARGLVNHKGLYAFATVDDLKKLFKQLCSIRDNEHAANLKIKDKMLQN